MTRGRNNEKARERERDVETMGVNSTTRVLQSDLTLTRVRLDLPGMVAAPVAEGFAEGSGAVATQAAESFAQGSWRDRYIYIYIHILHGRASACLRQLYCCVLLLRKRDIVRFTRDVYRSL